MMICPSKREIELRKKLKGWRVFDPETDSFSLKKDAPEDVRIAFEELKRFNKKALFGVISFAGGIHDQSTGS